MLLPVLCLGIFLKSQFLDNFNIYNPITETHSLFQSSNLDTLHTYGQITNSLIRPLYIPISDNVIPQ
jgi:hypothetical protein